MHKLSGLDPISWLIQLDMKVWAWDKVIWVDPCSERGPGDLGLRLESLLIVLIRYRLRLTSYICHSPHLDTRVQCFTRTTSTELVCILTISVYQGGHISLSSVCVFLSCCYQTIYIFWTHSSGPGLTVIKYILSFSSKLRKCWWLFLDELISRSVSLDLNLILSLSPEWK